MRESIAGHPAARRGRTETLGNGPEGRTASRTPSTVGLPAGLTSIGVRAAAILLWAALEVVTLSLGSSSVYAHCPLTTGKPTPGKGACVKEGWPLFWHTPCLSYSLVVRDHESLPFEDLRDLVDYGFQAWSDASCNGRTLPLAIRQTEELSLCERAEQNAQSGNVNTVAFLGEWNGTDYDPEAFALTEVWHNKRSGEIVGADMLLNDTMGVYTDCGTRRCPKGKIDLENVVAHEAGHVLGLGHSKVEDATMYWEAGSDEIKKRDLHADDIAGLCELYRDIPAEVECRSTHYRPQNGFQPECQLQQPSQCGCRLAGGRSQPGFAAGAALAVFAGLALRTRQRRR